MVAMDGVTSQRSFRVKVLSVIGGYSSLARLYRRLRPNWFWKRFNPSGKATTRYLKENGSVVQRGFAVGTDYPDGAAGRIGFLSSKLCGAYEAELEPSLELVARHDVFVDVGSGDGFYCVAAAKFAPSCTVIGFEMDDAERAFASKLAERNGVSVDFRATATPAELNKLPDGKLFVLIDVEGYEYELLDPVAIPRLLETTMLIEVHEYTRENLLSSLIERFESSHTSDVIHAVPRVLHDYPELASWPKDEAEYAVSEGRPLPGIWLRLDPIAS